MNLKLIKYDNTPGTFEASWLDDAGKGVRVTAYSGDQIQLLRDDVAQYGGDISEWEDLIAEIEAEWVPPPPPPVVIPQVVSRFQARAALHLAGLLTQVEAMMQDPATDMLAKLAWTDAQEFRRTSPTVLAMSQALGLTDAQLDELFTVAAGIEA
jgi:hypothetical protein